MLEQSSYSRAYRPDIDGLRAVAVLSVLLFHLGLQGFAGGFVGVDVFFVISGFLITRNIYLDVQEGNWSLRTFYLRRARRLLPALFVTLILSFAAGFLLLAPTHFARFGQSLVLATVSLSNFFFWFEAGYFDTSSAFKPLLHTWSLAVEEQYYLVWPALLVLALSMRRSIAWAAALIAFALSLAASQILLQHDPEAAFYLTPLRFFEFLIGAGTFWLSRWRLRSNWLDEAVFAAGLGLLVYAIVALDEGAAFPGLNALIPTLGAALLIAANNPRAGGWLLRNRVSVFIGLISYSLYLVHWPLLVFYGYWNLVPLTLIERAALLLVSLALATLMYRFVETPFRRGWGLRVLPSARQFATAGLAVCLVTSLAGAAARMGDGWTWRLPGEARSYVQQMTEAARPFCTGLAGLEAFDVRYNCRFGSSRPDLDVLVIGDSHADALLPGLHRVFQAANISALNVGFAATAPIRGALEEGTREAQPGLGMNRLFALAEELKPATVLLAARWNLYATTSRPGRETGPRKFVFYGEHTQASARSSSMALSQGLRDTVAHLVDSGINVALITQVPHLGIDPRLCALRPTYLIEASAACALLSYEETAARGAVVATSLHQLRQEHRGRFLGIDALDAFCGTARSCRYRDGQRILYRDDDHLSAEGSVFFAEYFAERLVAFIRGEPPGPAAAGAPPDRGPRGGRSRRVTGG